ncbi:unnamed protein product [Closterium sp. NIES-64]|nr:unnamed protein product [Closterium sp. NIES-64]
MQDVHVQCAGCPCDASNEHDERAEVVTSDTHDSLHIYLLATGPRDSSGNLNFSSPSQQQYRVIVKRSLRRNRLKQTKNGGSGSQDQTNRRTASAERHLSPSEPARLLWSSARLPAAAAAAGGGSAAPVVQRGILRPFGSFKVPEKLPAAAHGCGSAANVMLKGVGVGVGEDSGAFWQIQEQQRVGSGPAFMGNVFLVADPSKRGMLGVKVEPSPFTGMGEWVGQQQQKLTGPLQEGHAGRQGRAVPLHRDGRVGGAAATTAARLSGWDGCGVVRVFVLARYLRRLQLYPFTPDEVKASTAGLCRRAPARYLRRLQLYPFAPDEVKASMIGLYLSFSRYLRRLQLYPFAPDEVKASTIGFCPLEVAYRFFKFRHPLFSFVPDESQVRAARQLLRQLEGRQAAERFHGVPVFSAANLTIAVPSKGGQLRWYRPYFFNKKQLDKLLASSVEQYFMGLMRARRAARQAQIAAVDGAGAGGGGGGAEEEDPFDSFPDPHEFADDGMFPDPPETLPRVRSRVGPHARRLPLRLPRFFLPREFAQELGPMLGSFPSASLGSSSPGSTLPLLRDAEMVVQECMDRVLLSSQWGRKLAAAELVVQECMDRVLLGSQWGRKLAGLEPSFTVIVDSFERRWVLACLRRGGRNVSEMHSRSACIGCCWEVNGGGNWPGWSLPSVIVDSFERRAGGAGVHGSGAAGEPARQRRWVEEAEAVVDAEIKAFVSSAITSLLKKCDLLPQQLSTAPHKGKAEDKAKERGMAKDSFLKSERKGDSEQALSVQQQQQEQVQQNRQQQQVKEERGLSEAGSSLSTRPAASTASTTLPGDTVTPTVPDTITSQTTDTVTSAPPDTVTSAHSSTAIDNSTPSTTTVIAATAAPPTASPASETPLTGTRSTVTAAGGKGGKVKGRGSGSKEGSKEGHALEGALLAGLLRLMGEDGAADLLYKAMGIGRTSGGGVGGKEGGG